MSDYVSHKENVTQKSRMAAMAVAVFVLMMFIGVFMGGFMGLFAGGVVTAHAQENMAQENAVVTDDARDKIFNAESFMLENGMHVVAIPNHRAPVVTHMVWYQVGAADELPGQSGLAHYLEHMMFKGSENVAPGEMSIRVKALGGQDNAFTSQNFTAYFQSIAKEHLREVMTMEADRMRGLLLPAEDLESEKLVVIEERRQRTENDPRGYFMEQLNAALFKNHPYANPVVGWFHEIDALTENNVRAMHDKFYVPNNAWLIVSGDITAEELRPLAEEIYGDIPARDVAPREWTQVPPLLATETLELRHASIAQPSFTRLYRVPSGRQDKEASLALQVLENIVSGGASTRFYKSLVVDQKLATGAAFYYSGAVWSDAVATISVTPAEGVSMEHIAEAVDAQWRDIVENGVTEEELTAAKSRLKDAATYALDSLQGPAMIFGRTLTTGGTIDDLEYWPYDIDAVTPSQIQAVAAEYLNPDDFKKRPFVTGHILPLNQQSESAE
jgi:zinc protease